MPSNPSYKMRWNPTPGEGLTVARTVFLMRCNGASEDLVTAYIAYERNQCQKQGIRFRMGADAVWCDICGELVPFSVDSSVCSQGCHTVRRHRLLNARSQRNGQPRKVKRSELMALQHAVNGTTKMRRDASRCPHPEKYVFRDYIEANNFKRGSLKLTAEESLRPYECSCGAWHLGHDKEAMVAAS